ncbi:metalloprotease [Candidatus Woesearchaeota archaeon]|nr:metalloprotease [Candidatus Woesearchaeota archaeon]
MYQKINVGIISTSRAELIDIAKAWLALSLAFTFVYAGASLMRGGIGRIFTIEFPILFIISLFTAGLGFLLHELAHKFVAQHYGCEAEFRAFDQMLYLALGLAILIGFIFAAPGAVMISGMITRKENGLVSMAGPLTNYVLGLLFLGIGLLYPKIAFISHIGSGINFWLGLFNMIPFGNLDGLKVLNWNRYVWGGIVIIGIYLVFFLR